MGLADFVYFIYVGFDFEFVVVIGLFCALFCLLCCMLEFVTGLSFRLIGFW